MLDPKSTSDILSQIEQIQQKINQNPLNFKINIDSKEFNQLATSLEKIGTSMGKALNLNTSGLDKVSVTMNTTKAGYEFLEKKVKETTNAQGQLVKEVSRFKQEVDEAGNAQTVLVKRTEETVINYKKLQQAQQKLLDDFNKKNINAVDFEIQQRELEAKQFSNLLKAQMQKEQDLKIEKQKTAEIQKQIDLYKQRMLGDNGFKGELDIFSEKQKGKYDKGALAKIRADIEALNVSTPDLNNKIKQLGNQFSSLKQQASQSGNVMTRALENAFKFLRFYLVGGTLVGVVRAFKNAVDTVVELDKSLTELNKVVDLTDEQLKNITTRAYEVGTAIGRTGKEVIDATSEFAKAGYTLEQSFELSKAALVMQNVAEGINSTEEATSSLIAVLKGYSLESTKAMQIIDILNEVSNTTATNFDDLADGLRRTSGTLSQTGTSLEQLTGLLVGGFEPLRNIEQVSSGLIMISQRLRGIGEDGEAIDGLMPKLQKDFKEIANIDIIDPETNGLRSTYDILQDMARVFPTLSDKQRQYLGELAAGNRQVKVLNAILSNWQSVEGAIDSATNSMGSAMKENEKYLNSINGKISQFNSSVQAMWNNAINSDSIKAIVDIGTAVIKVVDYFGLLNTAIITATISLLLFNKGFRAFYNANIVSIFSNLCEIIQYKLVTALGMSQTAAIGLASAINMIAPIAVVAGIMALVSGIKYLAEETKRQQEAIRKLKEEYDGLSSSLEENESKQKDVIDRIKELYALRNTNTITDAEKEELIRLQNVNAELERQIKYEKELKAIKGAELERKTLDLANRKTESIPLSWEYEIKVTVPEKIEYITKEIESYTSQIDKLKKAYDDGEISTDAYNKKLKELEASRAKQVLSLEELITKLEEENKNYVGASEEGNKKKAANEIVIKSAQELIIALGKEEGAFKGVSDASRDAGAGLKQQAKSAEELAKLYDSATDSISDFSSSAEDLNSIFEDINEGQEISEKQLLSLIGKYPEFASQIVQLNNSKEEAIKLTNLLFEAEKTRTIEKLKNDKEELQSELYKLEAIRSAYIMLTSQGGIIPNDVKEGLDSYNKAFYQVRALDEAIKKLRESTLGDFKSGSNIGSKSTPSPIPYQDISSELIATYNTQVELDKLQAKSLERQIKTAEAAKDYNKAIELQNELLKNQEKTIADIKTANEKIHESANKMRKDNAQYDTTGWFDRFGNATQEYLNLIKSFEGKTDEASKRQLQNIEKLFSDLQKLKKAWNDNADAIIAMNDAIAQTKQNINETIGAISNTIRSEVKEYTKGLEQIMEVEEEAHKNRLDSIKKDKDAFSSYIDHQIDELDRLKASQDYATDVAEIAQEISKLQAEKNKFTLAANSGDLEATVRVNELAEEISKKQKELSKKQSDEEYRRRKQNLQDTKKNYEEEADAKIDAENEKYNAIKNNYNKLTRTIETFTDTSISLNTNMVDNMINDYDNLSKSFTENVRYMAIAFQQQFIDKLASAKTEITELNKLTGVSTNTSKPSGSLKHHSTLGDGFEKMSDAEFAQYVANKKAYEDGKITQAQRDYNEKLRKKYGIKVDRYSFRDLIGYYKDGGINTQTGIAMLHGTPSKPEFILNTEQMKRLVTNLAFNVTPPKYNIPKTGQKSEIRIDSLITVQGNVTKDTVPAIKNAGLDIVNKLKGLGVVINNG